MWDIKFVLVNMDDDIVHPSEKSLDTCNQLAAGSNPAVGASRKTLIYKGFSYARDDGRIIWEIVLSGFEKLLR